MKNNANPQGKKVLIVRDFFAYVVCPFLALQAGEIHICDMRTMRVMVGEKINVKEYINKINPNYVLVSFSGVGDLIDSRYDFY